MELTITELQNLLENKEWKALVEQYTKEAEDMKSRVLLEYIEGTNDPDNRNLKHSTVEQLKVAIELKEKISAIDLPAARELVKFIELNIGNYEKTIKNTLVAASVWCYTATDIEIRKANTIIDFIGWVDLEIEKLKNPKKEDNVMERIREE